MSLTIPTYVTREEVKAALDIVETSRSNSRVDRAIESATLDVEGLLRRRFSPWVGTRYFGWPDVAQRTPWRLWLDENEVIDVTEVIAGGVTIPPAGYWLEPANFGPPFSSVEINLGSAYAFQAGTTRQRAIAITGTFGYTDKAEAVGALAGTLAAAEGATASVTWTTATVGVGSLLRIGSERLLVTDRSMVASGQVLSTPLAATANAVAVAVSDGTAFGIDEILLLDSERMRVVDISGNTLVVKRAVDGSTLATHTGSAIYTLTGVQLSRAAQGSTLGAHAAADVIYRHVVPPLVRELALAYALDTFLQESAGYARVVGSGDNQMEAAGKGIAAVERAALRRHGRQLLLGAV